MPYTVNFESGHSVDFDAPPTPEMIQQVWSQIQSGGQPGQPSAQRGTLQDIAMGATGGVARGIGGVASGAMRTLAGIAPPSLPAEGDMSQAPQSINPDVGQQTADATDKWVAQHYPEAQTTAGRIAQTAGQMGGAALTGLATGQPEVAFGAFGLNASMHTAEQLQDAGVDMKTAANIGIGEAIQQQIPVPFMGQSLGSTIVANAVQGAVTRAASKMYLDHEGYSQQAANQPGAFDPESVAGDIIGGGVAHLVTPHRGEPTQPTKSDEGFGNRLDALTDQRIEPTGLAPKDPEQLNLNFDADYPPGGKPELPIGHQYELDFDTPRVDKAYVPENAPPAEKADAEVPLVQEAANGVLDQKIAKEEHSDLGPQGTDAFARLKAEMDNSGLQGLPDLGHSFDQPPARRSSKGNEQPSGLGPLGDWNLNSAIQPQESTPAVNPTDVVGGKVGNKVLTSAGPMNRLPNGRAPGRMYQKGDLKPTEMRGAEPRIDGVPDQQIYEMNAFDGQKWGDPAEEVHISRYPDGRYYLDSMADARHEDVTDHLKAGKDPRKIIADTFNAIDVKHVESFDDLDHETQPQEEPAPEPPKPLPVPPKKPKGWDKVKSDPDAARKSQADKYFEDLHVTQDMSHLTNENGFIDPKKAIAWIKENSHYPALRDLMGVLERIPKTLNNLFIQARPKDQHDGRASASGASGQYLGPYHHIVVGGDHTDDATIGHELVHAATRRATFLAESARPGQYPRLQKAFNSLKDILQQVQAQGKQDGDSYDFGYAANINGRPVGRGRIYGLKNVDEMLAEAFRSNHFQNLLKNLQVTKNTTAWDRVTNAVRDLLGLQPKTYDALSQVMDHGRTLMDETEMRPGLQRYKIDRWVGKESTAPDMESVSMQTADDMDKKDMFQDPRVTEMDKNMPGFKGIAAKYVPPAPDTKLIKETALQEPDLKNTFGAKWTQNMTVSAEMTANLMRSKATYMASRIYDRGQKLAHLYDEKLVTPLREQIKSLIPDSNWKSLKRVKDVMISEDMKNVRLKPEDLRQLGLSDPEMKVYAAMRKSLDNAMDVLNSKRMDHGLDPVTPRDAYQMSRWNGPWKAEVHMPVGDQGGTKMVGLIGGHSKQEVRNGLDYVTKNVKGSIAKDITYRKSMAEGGNDYITAYGDLTRLLGKNDEGVQAVRRALEMHAQQEGTNVEGFMSRFKDKAGMRYFEGDRPWVDPRKDTADWYANQMDYLRQSYKWSAMQDATGNMKKLLSDPDLNKQRPNLVNFLKEYSRNQLGFGKLDAVNGIENMMAKFAGEVVDQIPGLRNVPTSIKAQTGWLRNAKQLMYLKALGFWKPQHFIVNGIFQPAFTLPRHMKLSAEGYSHNPTMTFLRGVRDASAILLDHYTKGNGPQLDSFGQDAYNYLKTNQIATNNPFSDVGKLGRSRAEAALAKTSAVGGYFMQEGERVSRVNAFMSYAHHLQQSGKFGDLSNFDNKMELFREAERNTTETMGSFRHTDRPGFFTKMGMTGTALITLRQFEINMYNQLTDYSKYALENPKNPRNWAPLLALSSIQLAYAGVLGFFGMETLDQVYRWMRDMIPTRFVSKEFATWSPKAFVMQHLPFSASRGLVSPVTGINFASSLESGTIVDPSISGLFPFISEVKNTVAPAWNYFSNPTKDNLHSMIYNEAPYGIRGTLETGKFAGMDLPDAINTKSWFTSPSGVSVSPGNPGVGKYTRNPDETNIRSWGFMPTGEAATKEAQFTSKQNEQMLQERQNEMEESIMSGVRQGATPAQMQSYFQKYVEMGGNPQVALANGKIRQALIQWNTNYQQQAAMKVKDMKSAQEYQRLGQYLNQIQRYYGKQP